MRTHFELDEHDSFEIAKDLLTRRFTRWADKQGLVADPMLVSAALDFRHEGIDGRLCYWTPDLVREFLLIRIPRRITIAPSDAAHFPDSLRNLFRYFDETELADPGGAPLSELDSLLSRIGKEFIEALSNEKNFGIAKFWTMKAIELGVDITNPVARERFSDAARDGEVDYDDDVLDHIASRHMEEMHNGPGRAPTQVPIALASPSELASMAEDNHFVIQLRTFTEWVGDGRELTPRGNLKLADARELVDLLKTRDKFDPLIGDRQFHTKTSMDLAELTLIDEWARKLRLVRVVKNRLVRVAKNRKLLDNGLDLWNLAFHSFTELADIIAPLDYNGTYGMMYRIFPDVIPDILNTVYGFPFPVPVPRLHETIWAVCQHEYVMDRLSDSQVKLQYNVVGSHLRRALRALADIDALEISVGKPDRLFLIDVSDDPDVPPSPFDDDAEERLRAELSKEDCEMVALTPLGVQAVHATLIAAGRYAPIVGDLADASGAQLLNTVSEFYTPETARQEIAQWIARHGGDEAGLEKLLDAIRRCPFRVRSAIMLRTLSAGMPNPDDILRRACADEVIRPVALNHLIADGSLEQEDLTREDAMLAMTEQLLQVLEAAGVEGVEAGLAQLDRSERQSIMTSVATSGHPDTAGMAELRPILLPPTQHHPLRMVRDSRQGPQGRRKHR